MNSQGKIIAVLLATLLLGGVLGALLVGTLRGERDQERERLRAEGGIVNHFERTIEPESEEQREAIRGVLIPWEARNRRLLRRTHLAMKRGFDSILLELKPLLNDEQMERLRREGKRMRPRGPGGGPHPGRRRPGGRGPGDRGPRGDGPGPGRG